MDFETYNSAILSYFFYYPFPNILNFKKRKRNIYRIALLVWITYMIPVNHFVGQNIQAV